MTEALDIRIWRNRVIRYGIGTALLAIVACLSIKPVMAESFSGLEAISPQPDQDDIQPGLAVTYFYSMFEDVAYISKLVKGKPGAPIKMLDHDTNSGKVLTSKRSMGVGAEIRGMIQFPETGTYVLRVNSNDGVQVTLAGVLIHEDPYIHADSMSDPLEIAITQPGWYQLDIDYYQKKGTSALGIYWTVPNSETEVAVPESAYGHVK